MGDLILKLKDRSYIYIYIYIYIYSLEQQVDSKRYTLKLEWHRHRIKSTK